ncbi:MAG: 4Fe-4S binding protein, partial [Clostridia bacterium]|nr:4Fe-4S binding protein [Clostridia bacterium]
LTAQSLLGGGEGQNAVVGELPGGRIGGGKTEIRRVANVNPAVCQGCGACTVTCPSGAMDLKGFSSKQIMSEVEAICKK